MSASKWSQRLAQRVRKSRRSTTPPPPPTPDLPTDMNGQFPYATPPPPSKNSRRRKRSNPREITKKSAVGSGDAGHQRRPPSKAVASPGSSLLPDEAMAGFMPPVSFIPSGGGAAAKTTYTKTSSSPLGGRSFAAAKPVPMNAGAGAAMPASPAQIAAADASPITSLDHALQQNTQSAIAAMKKQLPDAPAAVVALLVANSV